MPASPLTSAVVPLPCRAASRARSSCPSSRPRPTKISLAGASIRAVSRRRPRARKARTHPATGGQVRRRRRIRRPDRCAPASASTRIRSTRTGTRRPGMTTVAQPGTRKIHHRGHARPGQGLPGHAVPPRGGRDAAGLEHDRAARIRVKPARPGSRILDIRSSRWYSNVAASSRMYGRIGLTASRKPARRPSVADSRQHALPLGPFGPGVPGRVPLSPGADPGHPGGEPGK
jgi:hypothetical protein